MIGTPVWINIATDIVTATGALLAGIAAFRAANRWLKEHRGKELFEAAKQAKLILFRLDPSLRSQRANPLPTREEAQEYLDLQYTNNENYDNALHEEIAAFRRKSDEVSEMLDKLHEVILEITALEGDTIYNEFSRYGSLVAIYIGKTARIRDYFSILLTTPFYNFSQHYSEVGAVFSTPEILSDRMHYSEGEAPNTFTAALLDSSERLHSVLDNWIKNR